MTNPLSREIIRKILANCGIAPPPNFGLTGLTVPELQSDKILSIKYEDEVVIDHSIWAGETKIQEAKLRAICVDISQNDLYEYLLIFQLENQPIYGIRFSYDDEDDGLFLLKESGNWVVASILIQIKTLLGMETIATYGLFWEKLSDLTDLYEATSVLIDLH